MAIMKDYPLPEPKDKPLWVFQQSTGKILDPKGLVVGFAYSGKGIHKNNPESQSLPNQGPIPEGYYKIGSPHDSITHGPFVLPLEPDPQNVMFGRTHFLVHGDSVQSPGTASEGCIVAPRWIREDIAKSAVKLLAVVSGEFVMKREPETVA
jgi:hypothetical protein